MTIPFENIANNGDFALWTTSSTPDNFSTSTFTTDSGSVGPSDSTLIEDISNTNCNSTAPCARLNMVASSTANVGTAITLSQPFTYDPTKFYTVHVQTKRAHLGAGQSITAIAYSNVPINAANIASPPLGSLCWSFDTFEWISLSAGLGSGVCFLQDSSGSTGWHTFNQEDYGTNIGATGDGASTPIYVNLLATLDSSTSTGFATDTIFFDNLVFGAVSSTEPAQWKFTSPDMAHPITFFGANVGINTTTPQARFSVQGNALIVGNATTTGNLTIGGGLTCSGTPCPPWLINGTKIYYNAGNVGVGTSNPSSRFEVANGTTTLDNLLVNNTSTFRHPINGGTSDYLELNSGNFGSVGSGIQLDGLNSQIILMTDCNAGFGNFQVAFRGTGNLFSVYCNGTVLANHQLIDDGSGLMDVVNLVSESNGVFKGKMAIGTSAVQDPTLYVLGPAQITATSTLSTTTVSAYLGIGTTTPKYPLHVSSNATTTYTIDSTSATKGACMKFKDAGANSYTYCTTLGGVLSCSTDSCE